MLDIFSIDTLEILRDIVFSLFIFAAIAVAAGVYWEKEEFPPYVRHAGWLILVWSLGAEIALTFGVFAIDGTISTKQRAKIISLEARSWTKEQYDAIQSMKGRIPAVAVIPERGCLECDWLAHDIAFAFHDAGAEIYGEIPPSLDFLVGTGVMAYLPPGNGDMSKEPVVEALVKAGIYGGSTRMDERYEKQYSIRIDIPIVVVGERYIQFERMPYVPSGSHQFTIHSLRK